jgi:hypothetical protein
MMNLLKLSSEAGASIVTIFFSTGLAPYQASFKNPFLIYCLVGVDDLIPLIPK